MILEIFDCNSFSFSSDTVIPFFDKVKPRKVNPSAICPILTSSFNSRCRRSFRYELTCVFKQKDIIHGGWRIWRARQEVKHYKTLPKKYVKASRGALLAPMSVVNRIRTGRWMDIPNVYDDYKGASFFERIAGAEFIPKELKII